MDKKVNVITDLDGRKIVIINDIRFRSRRGIDWQKVEEYLKEYVGELVQIATDKAEYPDYHEKHGSKAKYGWYRYDIRFGLPVYDESGNLKRYNFFSSRMLVRRDVDRKLYLYDFVRIKKETSKPPRQ